MEYRRVKLKEVCTVNQGLQIPISERFKEIGLNRYFYITIQFLKGNSEKYYIENPPKNVICGKDDILVVRTGSTGQVLTNVEGCFHNNFFKVTPNEKVYSKYLYYCLNNERMYKLMLNAASGTTIPDLKHSSFYNLEIPLPNIEEQIKIVYILSSIDKKIELNNKNNDNLQSLSSELYKRWFVDYEFLNENGQPYKSSGGKMMVSEIGIIPEGWEICSLERIIKKNNQKLKEYSEWENEKMIDLSVMPQFSIAINEYNLGSNVTTNIYKLSKGDILYGSIRPYFGKAGISPIDGVVTGTVYNYTSKIREYYEYVLMLTTRKEFIDFTVKLSKGTKMPVIGWKDFISYKIPLPPKDICTKFGDIIGVNIKKIIINVNENQNLIQLRNTLLPKLMNGEIDLEKVEM